MGHGDAYRPEVGRLCRSCCPLCDLCLLCRVDSLHPLGDGGTLSFSTRSASALVRMEDGAKKRKVFEKKKKNSQYFIEAFQIVLIASKPY